MSRMRKVLVISGIFSLVPCYILLTFLTRGTLEPHLPGTDTWNIQYLAHAVIGVAAAWIAFWLRGKLGTAWCAVLIAWNSSFVALALYATLSLWGDKY